MSEQKCSQDNKCLIGSSKEIASDATYKIKVLKTFYWLSCSSESLSASLPSQPVFIEQGSHFFILHFRQNMPVITQRCTLSRRSPLFTLGENFFG